MHQALPLILTTQTVTVASHVREDAPNLGVVELLSNYRQCQDQEKYQTY